MSKFRDPTRPTVPIPSEWDGSFYLSGPSSPLNTAIALYDYAPAFVTQAGGNIALAMQGGQVNADQEQALIADAKATVIPYFMNPANLAAYQAALALVPWGGWFSGCNDQTVLDNMNTGSGFDDIVTALGSAGYPQTPIADCFLRVAADYFTQFSLPSGVGSNAILAKILGVAAAWRIMDPIQFINPSTGQSTVYDFSLPLADWLDQQPAGPISWANHLGGEWVNVADPVGSKNFGAAMSYLNMCFNTRFSAQAGAMLVSLTPAFLDLYQNVQGFFSDISPFLTSANGVIPYNLEDLISPTPLTPSQKGYLPVSELFNDVNEHPPTYAGVFIECALTSGLQPLVPASYTGTLGCNCFTQSDPPKTSAVCTNNDFDTLVMKTWAQRITAYESSVPAGQAPHETSLLLPLAKRYA
jgi:hypothetical protein